RPIAKFLCASGSSGSFRKSILSETAGAGSRLNANRLHRRGRPFWGREPRDRFEPREPGAAYARAGGGQDLSSAVLPAFVKRKVRTAGRNRRFPDVKPGRQPERACSGSSG